MLVKAAFMGATVAQGISVSLLVVELSGAGVRAPYFLASVFGLDGVASRSTKTHYRIRNQYCNPGLVVLRFQAFNDTHS